MFSIPGQNPIKLTSAAVTHITRMMADGAHYGVRLGIKKGGCAGMEYVMEMAEKPDQHDEIIEQDGARVLIAPMAQMFLFGTEIDYETSLLESGFRFKNPNVSESCGCGESIKFDDALGKNAQK